MKERKQVIQTSAYDAAEEMINHFKLYVTRDRHLNICSSHACGTALCKLNEEFSLHKR